MAAGAGLRCRAKCRAHVAAVAIDVQVSAIKLESGTEMIEVLL